MAARVPDNIAGVKTSLVARICLYIVVIVFAIWQRLGKGLLYLITPNTKESVPPVVNKLLLQSACELARDIREKRTTSVAVVTAFIERIKEVNPVLNCVVDQRFAEALLEAKKADDLIESGSKSVEEIERETPLLGVPLSCKESIGVKGLSNSSGLLLRKGVKAEVDATAVTALRLAGAIPLVATNTSEICVSWESYNTVHGWTVNPYDTRCSVGGSSGGEGCLLGCAGSVIGIGSDLAGSVRIPAAFNGVFAHKPSRGFGSFEGHYPLPKEKHQQGLLSLGPMTRYACDLVPMLKIMSLSRADELRLDEPVDLSQLRVHYMEDDTGSVFVSSVDEEVKQCVREVSLYLQAALKVEVTQAHLPLLKDSMGFWFASMASTDNAQIATALADNKGRVNVWKELATLPASAHTALVLMTAALEQLHLVPYNSPVHRLLERGTELLAQQFKELLGTDGVFIYPTHPTVAPRHREAVLQPFNLAYTAVFNTLGFPATHCPTGFNSEGLPIGVQVVANLGQDRLTLAVARELEKGFGGWKQPA